MPALQLESPEALPAEFIQRLARHEALFQQCATLDGVLEERGVRQIAADLDEFLRQQWIHGYHCTKEPWPGFFAGRGLRVTDVAAHQEEFLAGFGDRFSPEEVAAMRAAWNGYFVAGRQARIRDGLVWACLTRSLVLTGGTEPFFELFGGEAISMPLKDHPTIEPKLRELGTAVVVEVALPGSELKANYDMSRPVLSRYHAGIRPGAHIDESEGRMRCAVPPEGIIRVTPLSDFRL